MNGLNGSITVITTSTASTTATMTTTSKTDLATSNTFNNNNNIDSSIEITSDKTTAADLSNGNYRYAENEEYSTGKCFFYIS